MLSLGTRSPPVDTTPMSSHRPEAWSLAMRPPPLSPGQAVWLLPLRPAQSWSRCGTEEPGCWAHSDRLNTGTCARVTTNKTKMSSRCD